MAHDERVGVGTYRKASDALDAFFLHTKLSHNIPHFVGQGAVLVH